MTPDIDPNYLIVTITLAKVILPPVVKALKRVINKSITVIVITRDK